MTIDERKKEYQNTVKIEFNTIHDQITKQDIIDWFSHLCTFRPTQMQLAGKYKRYKASEWQESIRSCNDNYGNYSLGNPSNFYVSCHYNPTTYFMACLPIDIWEQRKTELLDFLNDFFVRINGCFGYIVNCFDDCLIQNIMMMMTDGTNHCEYWQLDDSDFPGIRSIPWISAPGFGRPILDPSYLPGHREGYGFISFAVSPYMWTGPDIFYIIPRDTLKNVCACEENIEYAPDFCQICLWSNLHEYNHPTYRERQWAFREECDWKNAMQNLNEKFSKADHSKNKEHVSVEIHKGNFPNGGTLLARFYVDKHGKSCTKQVAYAYIEREMDGNTIVSQQKIKIERD